jgi:hypothetical protein
VQLCTGTRHSCCAPHAPISGAFMPHPTAMMGTAWVRLLHMKSRSKPGCDTGICTLLSSQSMPRDGIPAAVVGAGGIYIHTRGVYTLLCCAAPAQQCFTHAAAVPQGNPNACTAHQQALQRCNNQPAAQYCRHQHPITDTPCDQRRQLQSQMYPLPNLSTAGRQQLNCTRKHAKKRPHLI